jgi:glycogen debranching enzyme
MMEPTDFDISLLPFSRFGSYLVVNRAVHELPLGPGLYLQTVAGRKLLRRSLCRIDLLGERAPLEAVARSDGAVLILACGGAQARACFETSRTIRLAGGGCRLRLTVPAGSSIVCHPYGHGRHVVNIWPSFLRLLVEPLAGEVHVRQDADKNIVMETTGGDGFDLAITEFQSAATPAPHAPFDECIASVRREIGQWLTAMATPAGAAAHAGRLGSLLLWASTVEPRGLHRRPVVYMSKLWMSQVWSWDNCFNAMALVPSHPELAWDQLWAIFDHADELGCLPDSVNTLLAQYNFAKPPVHGWAVRKMMRQRPDFFTADRLRQLYPALAAWSNWWLLHRTGMGSVLPHYLHGNDSGWDNSTLFDRGVPLAAPDLAALLALQCEVLAELAERLDMPADARRWSETSSRLLADMMRQMWRGDRFVGRLLPGGEDVDCDSLLLCMPVVLGRRLEPQVATALVRRLSLFMTDYGLATERPASPHYRADGYWRGPIWAPTTLLIVDGLREFGEYTTADDIAGRFCRMCEAGGFAENFDALTGQALRDRCYTWTASVFRLLSLR